MQVELKAATTLHIGRISLAKNLDVITEDGKKFFLNKAS
jgi:hypothetical protein